MNHIISGGFINTMPNLVNKANLVHIEFHSTLHTRQSSTKSDKYQVSHRYSYFSWWWAHSRRKRVEKRNKHTKKNCAPSWLYLQDYTRMHGLQNIKYKDQVAMNTNPQ